MPDWSGLTGITIMTCITRRHRSCRKLLIAAGLGLGMLSAFAWPGSAFASLLTTDRSDAPVATEAAPPPAAAATAPPAPATAGVSQAPATATVQQPPASAAAARKQRRAPPQHNAMSHRSMAGQQRAHEERRAAARRAFIGGVIVGVAVSRFRR